MKARIYSFNKESNKKTRYFTKVHEDLRCAVRANDETKLISEAAQRLLANLIAMMQSKKSKIICVNQDFLTLKTGKKNNQNKNLLNQLADFITYEYHRSVIHEGKRFNYVYIIKFTDEGELRATRPDLFYVIDSEVNLKKQAESLGYIPKKLEHHIQKIGASYKYIRDTKKEIEDIQEGYHSISKVKKEKIKIKKKESPIETERKTCATSFINELAHVTDENIQEKPRLMTWEEEKAHLRGQKDREREYNIRENPEFNPISSFAETLISLTCKKGGDFQLEVETPDQYSPPRDVVDMPSPEVFNNSKSGNEMEQKEEEKPILIGQVDAKKMLLTNKILGSFGKDKADEILDNLEFTFVKPDKVAIRAKFGFMLSELEKRKIRSCIEAVYGESIQIVAVTTKTKIAATPQNQNPVTQKVTVTPSYYNKFLMLKSAYKGGANLALLDKFNLSGDSTCDKLIFIGYTPELNKFYQDDLFEEAVLKTSIRVKLVGKGTTTPCYVFCSERIKKDRDYFEAIRSTESQKFVMNSAKFNVFKENLKRFLPFKSSDHILKNFEYLGCSIDSKDNHTILGSTSDAEINDLKPFIQYIEEYCKNRNGVVELRYLSNSQLPIIITKK
jgi:hypothetical protein